MGTVHGYGYGTWVRYVGTGTGTWVRYVGTVCTVHGYDVVMGMGTWVRCVGHDGICPVDGDVYHDSSVCMYE